jgi:PhnB protein
MTFTPYLSFNGNCREAFTEYQSIFGGELSLMTFADGPADAAPAGSVKPDAIMHGSLNLADGSIYGADDPNGQYDGTVHGMCVTVNLTDPDRARQIFDGLSKGGQVQMPLSQTFFSPAFGMCTDRFGTPWMIMTEGNQE